MIELKYRQKYSIMANELVIYYERGKISFKSNVYIMDDLGMKIKAVQTFFSMCFAKIDQQNKANRLLVSQ